MLRDGVDYTWCPKCRGAVDWIDGRFNVWTCEHCDLLVNKRQVPGELCPNCSRALDHISGPLGPGVDRPPISLASMARRSLLVFLVLQAVFALVDPVGYPYLRALLVLLQMGAVVWLSILLLSRRELAALASDHSARIIHGIEHATMNVLEERGLPLICGQTTHGMFTIDIVHDGKHYEGLETVVGEAATDAISRIRFGERHLAYDRRCGTSLLVGWALLAFSIVAAGITGMILDVPVGTTFALTVGAGLLARAIQQSAGITVQRWLTVNTEFASALVTRVDTRISADGGVVTAIVMIDVIPRMVDVSAVAPVPL